MDRSLLKTQNGFTLLETLITLSLGAVAALFLGNLLMSAGKLQRGLASSSEQLQLKATVQLMLENKCSCGKALMNARINDMSNPKATQLELRAPGSTMVAGPVFAAQYTKLTQYREVESVAFDDLVELQDLGTSKIYWANLRVKTKHVTGKAMNYEDVGFIIPLKVEIQPTGVANEGAILSCYAQSPETCS